MAKDMTASVDSRAHRAQPEMAALFISDLHLQADMPRTTQAFLTFLTQQASRSQQLYLLGDIFEAWAGDDDIADPYHQKIVNALRQLAESGVQIFWMAGNRDFLVGPAFAAAAGLRLLNDPHVVTIAGLKIVLTHGDAQCTDDDGYMRFRVQVRAPDWQRDFLARPLAERKAIIASMRAGSRAAQRDKSCDIMDVNQGEIKNLFERTDANIMIHGHTHRPACHDEQADGLKRRRYVLSDWDLDGDENNNTTRGDWLALDFNGNIQRMDAGTLGKI
jgi:UDP-2,3-diacylglucosamine hydrolase